jgi:hypothetical protein
MENDWPKATPYMNMMRQGSDLDQSGDQFMKLLLEFRGPISGFRAAHAVPKAAALETSSL